MAGSSPLLGKLGKQDDVTRRSSWLLVVLGIAIIVAGVGQVLHGAVSTGYGVDEHFHVERLQNWHDWGWYLPDHQLDPDDLPMNTSPSRAVYAPAFAQLAHVVNVVLGNEKYSAVATTAAANDVRHLTVAVLGIVAVAAVGLTAWLVSGSPVAMVWAAAALSSIPVWIGHTMFNIKDVPTATGYTLVTLSLVAAATATARGRERWWTAIGVGIGLAVGIAIGVGTRTGSWGLVAMSVATYAALRVAQMWPDRRWPLGRVDGGLLLGGLAGLAVVFAMYPANAARPLAWFLAAIRGSADFAWNGYTLTAGELLDESPPWWYLPAWLGASLPLIISGLVAVGAVAVLYGMTRRGDDAEWARWRCIALDRRLPVVLVMQQLVLGPAAALALGSVLYLGLRQLLFIVPAIAVLTGLGVSALVRWLDQQHRLLGAVGTTVLAVLLLLPTVDQLRLHPYQYVYVNAVAGPVNERWESDYWFVGAREAIRRVPADAEVRCSYWLVRPWAPEQDPGVWGSCGRSIGPYLEEQGAEPLKVMLDTDEQWVVGRVRGGNQPPDSCREVGNVTRTLRGEDVLVTFVLACLINPVHGTSD